jgi:SNF2 family DNA or RNA helicase
MRRKAKDRLALLGQECMWYRIVIDEAHNIKNRNSKSSKACADLMAKHRLCMTGTPMMNSVDELFPLLRFLKAEPYCNWTKFSLEIAKPMKTTNEHTKKRALDRIQILIKAIMLRRQKDSVVDGEPVSVIPPKHSAIDNVEFEEEEHALYKALETKSQLQMNKYLQKGTVTANYANVLVLLLRLRQACCHPHLIKDLSQPATEGIAEDDLLIRAEELNDDVIVRLKANDTFECPICLEADPNPTIIIPCGHTVCGECVQKLIDPAMRAAQDGNDETSTPRCPHCRGELKARLITDYKHFCKVHCPDRLGSADVSEEEEAEAEDEDSDSDSEDEDEAPDVDKNGNLAGFIVDDDEDDKYAADEAEADDELGSAPETKVEFKARKSNKRSKGKGKACAKPKQTLAQLKKESLRNKSAKKRYLRRLDKTYIPSAKINRTVELIKEIKNNDPTEKTLIFSQFTSLLDLVEVPLHRERITYQRYDGSMKMDERANAVNAFMDDPNENVMLVSLKAGNAGLNLWKASQVIILDPFWNPFIEEQAIDRAHRMPQEREVYVHRIIVPETVEDRIVAIQDRKRDEINAALDEKASKSLTRLNLNELKYLFGMG